nr:hypothetical protein A5881_001956 [Enterococcus termitis]
MCIRDREKGGRNVKAKLESRGQQEKNKDEALFFDFLKGPQDQLPTVPFKTLDMIQEANKERLVFLELFNFLEEVKMSSSYIGEMDLRLIVVIKGIAYIKKNTEDSLHICLLYTSRCV